MPGPGFREYSQDEIDVALAALAVQNGDFKAAARFADVPIGLLRRWYKHSLRRPDEEYAAGARPYPTEELLDEDAPPILFDPDLHLLRWIRDTFLDDRSPIYNEHHIHLQDARLGVLWTNCYNERGGQRIVGTAEMPGRGGNGSLWQRSRVILQLVEWFGHVPDFLITLDARYCSEASDASFCATVDHELYHCGQKTDEFDCPAFSEETGMPLFFLKPHDFEGFHGVTERWGVGAAEGGVAQLVQVASREPKLGRAEIAGACGTCLRMVG